MSRTEEPTKLENEIASTPDCTVSLTHNDTVYRVIYWLQCNDFDNLVDALKEFNACLSHAYSHHID